MKTFSSILVFALFTCFSPSHAQVIGPDAPDVILSYASSPNAGFLFNLINPQTSNNYLEYYSAFDPSIDSTAPSQHWKFQGYLIFQLTSDTVPINETLNPTYSKLAAVVDVSDTISSVNLVWNGCISTPLSLGNTGTANDVLVTNDAFTSSPFLENESYCFRVLAFAANPFSEDPNCSTPNYALYRLVDAHANSVQAQCVVAQETVSLTEHVDVSMRSYPNPTKGTVFIEGFLEGSPNELTVFDELGREVLRKSFSESETSIELPHIGVFTLRIEKNGHYVHQKVIRL